MESKRFKLITYRYRDDEVRFFIKTLYEFKLISKVFSDWGILYRDSSTNLLKTPGRRKRGIRSYNQWPDVKEFLRLGQLQYYTITLDVYGWEEEFYNKFISWAKRNNHRYYTFYDTGYCQPGNIKEFYGEEYEE